MPSPNSWEHESFHKSYSSGVLPNKIPTLQFYQSERWMKWYALKKRSRPWTLCSCPWKWCRPSRKLLAKWLSNCMILSVFLNWFLTVMVPTMLSWSDISDGIHSSASSIFGKVEVSTVIGQWPGSTSIMFYLRVLPPGISKMSCHCTTSY